MASLLATRWAPLRVGYPGVVMSTTVVRSIYPVVQYDVAFFRGLARDRQAQRVYLAKVRIVETVRAKVPAQLCGGCKDNNLVTGLGVK